MIKIKPADKTQDLFISARSRTAISQEGSIFLME